MKQLLKKIVVFLLILEAKAIIKKYRPRIIAITGSVGKTSTKDAIFQVVAPGTYARKSQKSFNSELGLPLTILGRPNAWNNPIGWLQNLIDGLSLIIFSTRYPKWLVLEVGADRPGDIQSVAKWLPVEVAVITRLPEVPVHVEFFSSPDEVVKEKAALIDALLPHGTLVVYGDDKRAPELIEKAKGKHIVTFGFAEGNDVRAADFTLHKTEGSMPLGMDAMVETKHGSIPLRVAGALGAHSILPALAAVAVGSVVGKSNLEIEGALKNYEPPQGRMHIVEGIKGTTIIDDTYNSSPAAVAAALDTLKLIGKARKETNLPAGRQVAVLGDMLELGRHSVEEHKKAGAYAKGRVDILATVGFRARDIAEGALDAGMSEKKVLQYESSWKAGEEIAAMLKEGDVVLVKGSQSMRMERAVKELMAHPEQADKLLVRQDQEWQRR
jgi:UDP-N-acetylmuramyl pentapeptide synthase